MSEEQRIAIRSALQKISSLSAKEAKRIESTMYKMCEELLEQYDGETIEDIYATFAFEKMGQFATAPKDSFGSIVTDIKSVVTGWDSTYYAEFRAKEMKDTADHAAGMKVESNSEFPCRNPRCKSKETYYYQAQTRSADEPATCYVVCVKCAGRYKF